MTLNALLASFTGGEWSPSLYGRTDLAKYPTAVRTMKNFYPHPHGGASNRAGLEFIAESKDSTKKKRLIPFKFSVTQTYILEFGDEYMRVIKDGGQVVETAKVITDVTQANPAVVTSVEHEYEDGDYIIITGIVGMTELNERTFIVANKTDDTFELQDIDGNDIDSSGYSAYISGGESERIYQIETPYAEADLALLKYEQSADVLYVFHPEYEEQKITRTGHSAWTITEVTYAPSISAPANLTRTSGGGTGYNYVVTAIKVNGEESVPSTSVAGGRGDTFDWDTVTGADQYRFYEDHNGIFYYIGDAGAGCTFAVPSTPAVEYNVTPPQATNPFSGTGNYPGCAAFYEQRLVRARTNNMPQTLFGSVIGSFENHNTATPIRDDYAYEFTLNSRMVNEIRWLIALSDLIVGTSGGEWKISSGDLSVSITPSSVKVKVQSRWGVSHVTPIVIGNSAVFIEASGQVVRNLGYSIQNDGYTGNDLSILANHLFEGRKIVEWAYQQYPDNIIWCVMDDGALLGLTYNQEHEVWGWHHHETEGTFESVASITTNYGTEEVYFVVRRKVNGVYRRYIERLSQRLYSTALGKITNDVQDAFFVDCGLTLDTPIAISDITAADPVVVTTTAAHGLSDGDYVDISDVLWDYVWEDGEEGWPGKWVQPDQLNTKRYKVANATSDTFELQDEDGVDIDGTDFEAYDVGGYVRKAVLTISGLDHLEGEEVVALANGSVVDGLTVTAGTVTLVERASRIHIGLGYECDLETMEIEYQTPTGSVQGQLRDTHEVTLRLRNTREIWIGGDENHLREVAFRENEDYGQPTALFNGDKMDVLVDPGEVLHNRVFIRVSNPVPTTVLTVVAKVTNEE